MLFFNFPKFLKQFDLPSREDVALFAGQDMHIKRAISQYWALEQLVGLFNLIDVGFVCVCAIVNFKVERHSNNNSKENNFKDMIIIFIFYLKRDDKNLLHLSKANINKIFEESNKLFKSK